MQIVLLQDVKSLGKKGQIVNVNDGYARNFILPKKLGEEANNASLAKLAGQKKYEDKVAAEKLAAAKELAEKLQSMEVKLAVKVGEGGKIFGSVSNKEIAEAAEKQYNIKLDKKKIVIAEPIKAVGNFNVNVKLHPEVSGELKVVVSEA